MTPDGYVKTGDAGFFDQKTGHLKIIDRAKDVGRLNDGTLFAPKYIENKLKFFPNIREAVAYGDQRDFVAAMINIDLDRGRQAGPSATTSSTAPTRSWPAHPLVYDMVAKNVEEINRALADGQGDGGRADQPLPHPAQGTRRRRRRTDAHAEGSPRLRRRALRSADQGALRRFAAKPTISTEVTFEDGRKGMLSARVKIRDVATTAAPPSEKAA